MAALKSAQNDPAGINEDVKSKIKYTLFIHDLLVFLKDYNIAKSCKTVDGYREKIVDFLTLKMRKGN